MNVQTGDIAPHLADDLGIDTTMTTAMATETTLLNPRFYTTDFDEMAAMDISINEDELLAILPRRRDYAWHRWTEQEEALLLEQCGKVPLEKIAMRLGVGLFAVTARLHRLGVRQTDCQGLYTTGLLGRQLDVPMATVRGWTHSGCPCGRVTRQGLRTLDPREVLGWVRRHSRIVSALGPGRMRKLARLAGERIDRTTGTREEAA
jgi:hypothetical protein